jgi:hypothetical protein
MENCNNCLKGIGKLNKCEIIALSNSVSLLLSEGLDGDDLDMLGNLLSTIGSILSTFAVISDGVHERDCNDCKE